MYKVAKRTDRGKRYYRVLFIYYIFPLYMLINDSLFPGAYFKGLDSLLALLIGGEIVVDIG